MSTLPRALARQAVEPIGPSEGPYFGRLLRVAAHVDGQLALAQVHQGGELQ